MNNGYQEYKKAQKYNVKYLILPYFLTSIP